MKHNARKRFGQNFLVDKHILQKMAEAINAQTSDHIVEIGPGLGDLTRQILPHCSQLDAIEIDRDLYAHLQENIPDAHFTLHCCDVLKFALHDLKPYPLRVVGNLPYNISTPILFHVIDAIDLVSDMHFLLQKEVVDRIAAQPGDKNYGRLSIMIQYWCKVQNLFAVSRHAFQPVPQVESAFFRLIPHQTLPHPAKDYQRFAQIVQTCFNHRRKTLRKSLSSLGDTSIYETCDIDLSLRPETLSVADFVTLSNCHG